MDTSRPLRQKGKQRDGAIVEWLETKRDAKQGGRNTLAWLLAWMARTNTPSLITTSDEKQTNKKNTNGVYKRKNEGCKLVSNIPRVSLIVCTCDYMSLWSSGYVCARRSTLTLSLQPQVIPLIVTLVAIHLLSICLPVSDPSGSNWKLVTVI